MKTIINYLLKVLKNSHLIMAFLFGIAIGLMQYGFKLNWLETEFALFGFNAICIIHYTLILKEFEESI